MATKTKRGAAHAPRTTNEMAYSERSQHNEGREPVMRDVRQVLNSLREGSTSNPDVLAIEGYNIMLALNKGFPKHMYHEKLDPVVAADKQDEDGLRELGYTEHYISREFPAHIYRRNFHPRFALQLNQNGMPQDATQLEFIETRVVRDAEQMAQIKKEPKPMMPMGIAAPGPWVQKVTDIAPIEAETEEERMLEKARMQGQLEQAEKALAALKK